MRTGDKIRLGILGILVLVIVGLSLYQCNVFVFDHSAVADGNAIVWNGARYVPYDGKYDCCPPCRGVVLL